MPESSLYILTGPVQSGKTSALLQWAEGRTDVQGVLTPVRGGKRFFRDIGSGDEFSMEAEADEKEVFEVGRFVFSKRHFEKAIQYLYDAMDKKGWLVIDEIGPLELRGEGFHALLLEIVQQRKAPLILVIREGLLADVRQKFGIQEAIIISPDTLMSVIPASDDHHG